MEEKNNARHFNISDVDHENFYMLGRSINGP